MELKLVRHWDNKIKMKKNIGLFRSCQNFYGGRSKRYEEKNCNRI